MRQMSWSYIVRDCCKDVIVKKYIESDLQREEIIFVSEIKNFK